VYPMRCPAAARGLDDGDDRDVRGARK
jgi:hypothetical protein